MLTLFNVDGLVKKQLNVLRWLDKKFDIQVSDLRETPRRRFLAGSRLCMWYIAGLPKTYNEGDRTFYDAINVGREADISLALTLFSQYIRIVRYLHNKLVVFRSGRLISGPFR